MPPKPHPLRSTIAKLLREGLLHREISERLDVGEPLVGKVARLERLTRGRGGQGPRAGSHRTDILTLAAEQVAPGEIALNLGCSRRLVEIYLLEQRRDQDTN